MLSLLGYLAENRKFEEVQWPNISVATAVSLQGMFYFH